MSLKRIIAVFSLPLFLSSFLLSQSLVELAKKEKERREKLKGKKTIVVTNYDLKKVKKKPAVSIRQPVFYRTPSKKEPTTLEKSSSYQAQPSVEKDIDKREPREDTPEELEAKWNKAKEYVDLLTTKLNGLWHEFYNMNSMRSKETIQQQIADTSENLQKAKTDEARARKEFQQLGRRKKFP